MLILPESSTLTKSNQSLRLPRKEDPSMKQDRRRIPLPTSRLCTDLTLLLSLPTKPPRRPRKMPEREDRRPLPPREDSPRVKLRTRRRLPLLHRRLPRSGSSNSKLI